MFQKIQMKNNFIIKNLFILALFSSSSLNTAWSGEQPIGELSSFSGRNFLPSTLPSEKINQAVLARGTDDLNDLMEKIQFSGPLRITNETKKKVTLTIRPRGQVDNHHDHSLLAIITHPIQSIEDAVEDVVEGIESLIHAVPTKEIILKKGEHLVFNLDSLHEILGIQKSAYFNISSLNPFSLTINNAQRLIFPQTLEYFTGDFNFIPHAFFPPSLSGSNHEWVKEKTFAPFHPQDNDEFGCHPHYDPAPGHESAETIFKKQYDCHLIYLTQVQCVQESILPADLLFKQRQRLYEDNNFNTILSAHESEHSSRFAIFGHIHDEPRIPLITHRIWLTNPDSPKDLPDNYFEWATFSMRKMPSSEGWIHNLWIQDKKLLPLTVSKAKKLGIRIQVISKELGTKFKGNRIFQQALSANKFGQASDILRCSILYAQGGIYPDTDYLLAQSPLFLNRTYDFFAGIEPMSALVANSFIAAKPAHPIIDEALRLMVRNFSDKAPRYIKDIDPNSGFKTIQTTGPGMFSLAVFKGAGKQGNRDIIFPPFFLYPTEGTPQTYPQPVSKVVKPNAALPFESLGDHFWDGSWIPGDTAQLPL